MGGSGECRCLLESAPQDFLGDTGNRTEKVIGDLRRGVGGSEDFEDSSCCDGPTKPSYLTTTLHSKQQVARVKWRLRDGGADKGAGIKWDQDSF
jgi:hypothetical protein